MKALIAVLIFVSASSAFAKQVIITGSDAAKLWDSLPFPVVGVHDEHGGPDFAEAKYGTDIGCERRIADGKVSCWLND